MRVALLTNILTPYRLPVYQDLAATPGWTLRFMVGAEGDPSWQRAYAGAFERGRKKLDVEVVRGLGLRRRTRVNAALDSSQWVTLQLPLGAWGALARFEPDVVLSAELGPRSALASAWAARSGAGLVLWSYLSRSQAAAAGPLRQRLRRALLARADAVVGMGAQAREALRALGVAEARLFDAPNAHDVEGWQERLARVDASAERAALRAGLGLRERVALAPMRLEASKGVGPLLRAWSALDRDVRGAWTLLFVGDGPERAAVENARAALGPGAVARLPALPPDDLARLYAASDLLLFPSLGDPWGLVVNEAMAAGLPVLCSSLAGCADDLVVDGETGWRFDPTDAAGFRSALERALGERDAHRLGERACAHVAAFTPARQAEGLRRAVRCAARR